MSPNTKAVLALALGTFAAFVAVISALTLGAMILAKLYYPRGDLPIRACVTAAACVLLGTPLAIAMFRYRRTKSARFRPLPALRLRPPRHRQPLPRMRPSRRNATDLKCDSPPRRRGRTEAKCVGSPQMGTDRHRWESRNWGRKAGGNLFPRSATTNWTRGLGDAETRTAHL